jgi:pseudouridine-5'-phosphate glycosidase
MQLFLFDRILAETGKMNKRRCTRVEDSRESIALTVRITFRQGQIAAVYRVQRSLGLDQGLLAANPVPKEHEIPRETVERYLIIVLAETL